MEKPLVSVVVVSYNHAKYIRENLDSIKAQTYRNIELIVADDASQDNSVEVFEQWLSENNYPARKNFHKKNTGLATMLNECTEMLTGKYVKFIAADDFLHPESIAKCVEKLEELGEEFGMVFTDFYTVSEEGEIKKQIMFDYENAKFLHKNILAKDQLLHYNCIIAPTTLIRTATVRITGKYNSNMLLEDHERWLKINNICSIGFIPLSLAYYRILPTSITGTRNDRMVIEDAILRMNYDYSGINKHYFNNWFEDKYKRKEMIDKELLKYFGKYKYHSKALFFFMKYNLPFRFFEIYKIFR